MCIPAGPGAYSCICDARVTIAETRTDKLRVRTGKTKYDITRLHYRRRGTYGAAARDALY